MLSSHHSSLRHWHLSDQMFEMTLLLRHISDELLRHGIVRQYLSVVVPTIRREIFFHRSNYIRPTSQWIATLYPFQTYSKYVGIRR